VDVAGEPLTTNSNCCFSLHGKGHQCPLILSTGAPGRFETPRNQGDSDAPHMSPVTPSEDARTILINRISWGAILVGIVIALVVQLILSMFGIGIGAATLDPGTGDNPSAQGFSMTAAIWWAVSGIIASAIGGYAAGRLSGAPKESTAAWHGLASWAATTLVIFYLATTTATTLLGGAFSTISSAIGGAASTAGNVAQSVGSAVTGSNDPFAAIQQAILGQKQDNSNVRDTAVASVRALLTGNPSDMTKAREEAAQALATAQGIPIEQAHTQVQQYEQQYRETAQTVKLEATEAADTAATAVSTGALIGAVALLLGALAAWFGGRFGTIDPTMTVAGLPRRRRS
jgi:hypothetical protein